MVSGPADGETYPWDPLSVSDVAVLMAGSGGRWWLSGGQALDHFLGFASRPHGDIDVSVQRSDWPAILGSVCGSLEVFSAVNGTLTKLGAEPVDDEIHNYWARPIGGGPWCLQLNIEEVDGDHWLYRRDRRISRPISEAIWPISGVPTMNPALQLLWKSRAPIDKDDHDLELILPRLSGADLTWLMLAIRGAHPNSPWLRRAELRPSI